MKRIIILQLLLLQHAIAQIPYGYSFEGGSDSAITTSSIAGKDCIKFTLNATDKITGFSKRAEIGYPFWKGHKEQIVSFSTLFPDDYTRDISAELFCQFHDMPDTNRIGGIDNKRETWRSPPVLLMVRNDSVRLRKMWSKEPVNSFGDGETDCDGLKEWNLGAVPKGRWTDWKIYVKFSWRRNGRLQLWQDGILKVDDYGPNSYNDLVPPSLKVGIYKYDYMTPGKYSAPQRVIYFANLSLTLL